MCMCVIADFPTGEPEYLFDGQGPGSTATSLLNPVTLFIKLFCQMLEAAVGQEGCLID